MLKRFLVISVVLSLFGGLHLLNLQISAQTRPLTLRQILNALYTVDGRRRETKTVLSNRIAADVKARGVDFPLDRQTENLLLDDGATAALIEAIRANSPPVIPKKTVTANKTPPGVQSRRGAFGIELVSIPAGKFMIGSPLSDKTGRDDERPQKEITFTKGFWLGKYEVTQAQWRAAMGRDSTGCFTKTVRSFSGDNLPVVCVDAADARDFIARLNAKNDGFVYSLPTEVQWEYAARGGTKTRFYWGELATDPKICRYENVFDLTARDIAVALEPVKCRDGFFYLAPVGSFEPNAFGLHDLLGNVSEWVEAVGGKDYSLLKADGSAGISAVDQNSMGVRGGDWRSDGDLSEARVASRRISYSKTGRDADLGFRIAARLK